MATRDQIRAHLRDMRRMMRLEKQMSSEVEKELSKRTMLAAEGFEKMGLGGVTAALNGHMQTMLGIIQEQYRRVGQSFANTVIDKLKGVGAWETKDFDQTFFDDQMETYITDFATQQIADDISQQTKVRIRNRIEAGVREGLGSAEIAKTIRQLATRKISRIRSHIIARTETHNAAGYAQDNAARASGVDNLKKTWLTAMDPRVRDAHMDADGEKVEMEGVFTFPTVSASQPGYELAYPGDRSGPPYGVIMCRCFLAYEED